MKEEKTILVVDDEEDILKILDLRLRYLGYKTVLTSSGEKALQVLAKKKVDLIILDIMMPDTDGISVLLKLKSNPETKDIPVLMLSAIHQEEEIRLAKTLGALDYIKKPFSSDEIKEKLNAIWQKS